MIPIRLTLRNFLSYRDTAELDFMGLHLACISGPNGVGKSTILEAITWALFGKSRVKSDDDIVNRDAAAKGQAAEVSFTFELEGAVYRVIRRKAAGKTTELEFNTRMPDATDDRWGVRTEAKLRDTEGEIERLLRMNYDVFTNASFLLQGKADEFTTNPPGKRKEILADILGVKQWDEYKERATERRKGVEGDVMVVDRRIEEIEVELRREEEYTRALEGAGLRVVAATAERDRQDALVAIARQNKALAEEQRGTLRRIVAELDGHEAELARIESAAAQRRDELAGFRTLLERRETIAAAWEAWQGADAELAALQAKAGEDAAIEREIHPLEVGIARAESQLQQQIKGLQDQQKKVEKAAAELATIRDGLPGLESRRDEMRARLADFEAQRADWGEARARLQTLDTERNFLEGELGRLQAQAGRIADREKQRIRIDAELQVSRGALEEAQIALGDLADKRAMLETKATELATCKADSEHLKIEMDDLKARKTMLESEAREDCPLCGQSLTAEHRQHAIRQIQTQGEERAALYRGKKPQIETLTQAIGGLSKALQGQAAWEKKRNDQQAAVTRDEERLKTIDSELAAWHEGDDRRRLGELEARLGAGTAGDDERDALLRRIEGFQAAAAGMDELNRSLREVDEQITRDKVRGEELERVCSEWETRGRQAIEEAERRLAENGYAETERSMLAAVKDRRAAIAYDASAHAAARSRLDELSAAPEEHQRLQQAEAAVKPLADSLAELTRQGERAAARAAELRIQREEGRTRLQALESGIGDLDAAERDLFRLRDEVISASQAEGAARQRVEVLAVRREDRRQLAAQKKTLARQISLLKQLEEACGRNGVQALLIDAALPEIEAYANDLLFRLSGGDMNVRFKTQRAAKSKGGGLIETLDIAIADSFGERPYENYSGGEKFRVNFAIRLALSQVLARRAGARLRTLVIDEGFGSQDPEGRQRLVEAINTVQDEFACILVITHIDELRDKFPARIDVEKTSAGSRFSIATI